MIRVLTLNLQHALPGPGALSDPATAPLARADITDPAAARQVLGALALQLREISPDVIALQEVDLGQARSGRLNQAAELASALGWDSYRFAATYAGAVVGLRRRPRRSALDSPADDVLGPLRAAAGLPMAGFGNALLTRLPVESWAVQRLGRGPALVTSRAGRGWDPRSYRLHTATARCQLAATLAVPGWHAPLTVSTTHLATRSDVAARQLAAAWAALAARPGAHLLAGDLNMRGDRLREVGLARQVGEGETFPSGAPSHRIDYFLTDPWPAGPDGSPLGLADLAASQVPVLRARAWGVRELVVSDHAATWVDLEEVGQRA
ncbi:endonuclease/exonuclease/phosphatase family protein [Actinomyces urogenitalis DSM 15434]|uniref:Endonuclease/exonuclease/phosphatase family protein n=2 Tax=Actinomyces urogenitalis TaxID=103621 RepID=C0W5Q6_9ACTO|nr:endonuclease/exonuclease/phosphatase family protein [Actinomyces urogenitalis]EEH65947.1 endonuclease/exonuclease/phosphatase family protein [Actinomyces urogenitalis DSM 15434]MDU6152397.1 endonuclease/exonuclease/phosphatase family protein [Actinomyces urogenitalis]